MSWQGAHVLLAAHDSDPVGRPPVDDTDVLRARNSAWQPEPADAQFVVDALALVDELAEADTAIEQANIAYTVGTAQAYRRGVKKCQEAERLLRKAQDTLAKMRDSLSTLAEAKP